VTTPTINLGFPALRSRGVGKKARTRRATRIISWLAAGALLSGLAAGQTDLTVFGLALSRPLSVPECEIAKVDKRLYAYSHKDKVVCFRHMDPNTFSEKLLLKEPGSTPALDEIVIINFPEPPRMSVGEVRGTIVHGRLEGISLTTGGASFADQDMADLTRKYGEPDIAQRGVAMNLLGARIPTIAAVWNKLELTVKYRSLQSDDIEFGSLEIETPVALKTHDVKPDGPKL
jgi:hypothetical protein